jgi:hypothetical protein
MFYVTHTNSNQILKGFISDHFKGPFCATVHITKNLRSEHTGVFSDITQGWNYWPRQLIV